MRRKTEYFPPSPGDPPPVSAEIERTLRFSEVDALAIAWHGGFPRFFDDAHTELMRKLGLTFSAYRAEKLGAPVVQFHTDYYIPLKLDEHFRVRAAIHWTDGARLNVSYSVFNEAGKLAASGYTVQMFFDLATHEPHLVPPPLFDRCRNRWRTGGFA